MNRPQQTMVRLAFLLSLVLMVSSYAQPSPSDAQPANRVKRTLSYFFDGMFSALNSGREPEPAQDQAEPNARRVNNIYRIKPPRPLNMIQRFPFNGFSTLSRASTFSNPLSVLGMLDKNDSHAENLITYHTVQESVPVLHGPHGPHGPPHGVHGPPHEPHGSPHGQPHGPHGSPHHGPIPMPAHRVKQRALLDAPKSEAAMEPGSSGAKVRPSTGAQSSAKAASAAKHAGERAKKTPPNGVEVDEIDVRIGMNGTKPTATVVPVEPTNGTIAATEAAQMVAILIKALESSPTLPDGDALNASAAVERAAGSEAAEAEPIEGTTLKAPAEAETEAPPFEDATFSPLLGGASGLSPASITPEVMEVIQNGQFTSTLSPTTIEVDEVMESINEMSTTTTMPPMWPIAAVAQHPAIQAISAAQSLATESTPTAQPLTKSNEIADYASEVPTIRPIPKPSTDDPHIDGSHPFQFEPNRNDLRIPVIYRKCHGRHCFQELRPIGATGGNSDGSLHDTKSAGSWIIVPLAMNLPNTDARNSYKQPTDIYGAQHDGWRRHSPVLHLHQPHIQFFATPTTPPSVADTA